jgi:transmembrane sensor
MPVLVAGDRAVIPVDRPPEPAQVEKLAPPAIRATLAWQAPRLVFVGTPLADVIAQFNRRNRVQLSLDDAVLAQRPVGGTFQADNVEAFVRLLEASRDVRVERPDPDHVILRGAP